MRFRLISLLLVILAITLGIASSVLFIYYQQNTIESMDDRLNRWADDLSIEVIKNPDAFKRAPADFLVHPRANEFSASGILVQFRDIHGKNLAKSASLIYQELPFFLGREEVFSDMETQDGTRLKVYQQRIVIRETPIGYVVVAANTGQLYKNLDNLKRTLLVVMVCTVLVLGLALSVLMISSVVENQKRFLSFASHELRTPLSVISGTAEVALRKSMAIDDYQKALQSIKEESDWMARMVFNSLFVFRSQSSMQKTHKDDCNLADLIMGEITTIKKRYPDKQIMVALPDISTLRGDSDQLRRLLHNLLDNAAKNTLPEGKIEISATYISEKKRFIITIRDNGCGIAKSIQKKIFQPYFRADASDAKTGAGLGLAIVKWVTQAHRGTIALHSEPGQGAEFVVTLPAV